MKAMIGVALMVLGVVFSAAPSHADSANEPYFWKGILYQIGPFYGCWTVRYGKQGWNNNCNCDFVQRVVVRDGKRFVRTVRECSN